MGQRNPNHQLIDGYYIPRFTGFQHVSTIPNWWFLGFRWPIHSITIRGKFLDKPPLSRVHYLEDHPTDRAENQPIVSPVIIWILLEYTWWLIPLSKWVITPVISGLTLLIPFITGVITHLLSGMSHQVPSGKLTSWPWKHTILSGN